MYSLLFALCWLAGGGVGILAQSSENQTFPAATGDTLVVQNDYGRVRVQGMDSSVAEVHIRKMAADPSQLKNIVVLAQQGGPKLFVTSYFYDYQAESVYLDILVPRQMNVVIWGANPAVEMTALDGYVHVFTQTGLVTATDLIGSVSLTTEHGDILFRNRVQPESDVRLESIHGKVRAHLAEGLNLRGWLRSGGPLRWHDEVEMEQGHLERQVGVGGPLLLASSLDSSVSVDFDLTLNQGQAVAQGFPPPAPRQPSTANSTPRPRTDRPRSTETGDPGNPGETGSRDRGTAPVLRPAEENPSSRPANSQAGGDAPVSAPSSNQEPVDYRTNPDGTVDSGYSLKVDVNWTYLNVSVRDRYTNRSVPDLRMQDFQVFEDGQEQRIEKFESTESPFSLLLLLDVSGSTKDAMDLIKDASVAFTQQIKPNDRIGVATFNSRSRLVQDFTNDRNAVAHSIRRIRSGGGTAFYDALETSVNYYMQGMEGRKAIVVFSDGVDNQLTGDYSDGSQTTFPELYRDIQEVDTIIYTIFLSTDRYAPIRGPFPGPGRRSPGRRGGSVIDVLGDILRGGANLPGNGGPLGDAEAYALARRQMQAIADQTGGRMYAPLNIADLRSVYSEIADDLRVQYTLAYNSTNPVNDGSWREIRVKIRNRNDLAARTRRGYYTR